jgi:hypothetical protein
LILLLNGAFGIGKTTVGRSLAARMPRSVVFDAEILGVILQRAARLSGRKVDDFQDLVLWRRLTVTGLRVVRMFWPNVVVPMAFSNVAYLQDIRTRISRFEPRLFHFCLVAPVDVVHARLRARGADSGNEAWQYRRASECCAVHDRPEFSTQVLTANRDPDEIAEELFDAVTSRREQTLTNPDYS